MKEIAFFSIQGLPEDGDTTGARLQENGQLVFIPKLKSDAQQAAIQPNLADRPEHLRLAWINPWN